MFSLSDHRGHVWCDRPRPDGPYCTAASETGYRRTRPADLRGSLLDSLSRELTSARTSRHAITRIGAVCAEDLLVVVLMWFQALAPLDAGH